MKRSFEFLRWLLKPFIILREIQSKSSQNFMLIKIRYPNHRHGSDFLCEFEKVKSEPNDANTPMSLSDAVSSRVFKYKCLQCGKPHISATGLLSPQNMAYWEKTLPM